MGIFNDDEEEYGSEILDAEFERSGFSEDHEEFRRFLKWRDKRKQEYKEFEEDFLAGWRDDEEENKE